MTIFWTQVQNNLADLTPCILRKGERRSLVK